ncbi:hypothetical protein HZS_2286 [Henneguya salminicola]|nr:hypothetical protein HZS_2286 [Henneguya salminicola]
MSVPTVISCAELVNFCSPFSNLINHIRVLSSSKPGLYLSIIKFIDDLTAQQFFELNHGKLINPDNRHSICNLAYVHSVTYLPTNKGGFLANDHQTELPNCPICLERMDESLEGILTVLCDHSFHAECLMKWPDIKFVHYLRLRCPVCRYIQSPTSSETMTCSECDNKNDLWMCLICGNLACGRYENKHAFKHFEETGHTFSLKIGSSVVWDYAGGDLALNIT